MLKKSSQKKQSLRITKRLLDDVARGKKTAFQKIEQIGSRAVKPLLKAMQSPFPEGVYGRDGLENFTGALSRAAEYDAGPLIEELVEVNELVPDPYLWLAYAALGDSQDERVTDVLLAGLSHKSPLIRDQCLSDLCRRRTPGIVEHILPRVCDRSSDVCFTAVSALLKYPEYRDERAIPYLERLLKRKRLRTHSPGTRSRAMAVLEKIGAERSGERIERLDLSEERVDLKELKEIIARQQLKSLNLTDAKGVDDRVIETVAQASGLEELILYEFDVLELNLLPLGKLKKLKKLDIGNIIISGKNAKVLAELPLLEYLALGGTAQGDEELKSLKKLKNIRHLELDFHTTDAGFRHIQHLTKLESLFSLGWQVTAAALKYLKRMKHLRYLRFHYCRVGEGSLEDLLSLPSLEVLRLEGCRVTDEGLKTIGKMKQLRFLDVAPSKQITDRGVRYLKSLKHLTGLDLRSTQITDESIETLIKLPRLRQFLCDNTKITRAGRERLGSTNPDCTLEGISLSIPTNTG